MKRVLFILFILVVIFSTMIASAESSDLDQFVSSLSDQDVLCLFDIVKNEIEVRGLSHTGELLEGVYYVGEDIASGTYILTNSKENSISATCYYFETKEEFEKIKEAFSDLSMYMDPLKMIVLTPKNEKRLVMNDGGVIFVWNGTIKLTEEVENGLKP